MTFSIWMSQQAMTNENYKSNHTVWGSLDVKVLEVQGGGGSLNIAVQKYKAKETKTLSEKCSLYWHNNNMNTSFISYTDTCIIGKWTFQRLVFFFWNWVENRPPSACDGGHRQPKSVSGTPHHFVNISFTSGCCVRFVLFAQWSH